MATGIGNRIREKRKEIGITQDELAKRMGLTSKSTICKVETGKEDNLTLDRVAKYAEALGCSPHYLMGWDEKEAEPSHENAVMLATVMKSATMAYYIKKINALSDEKKEALFKYIDFLSSTD